MRIDTRPRRPSTMRITEEAPWFTGMKSISATVPSAVSNNVSRMTVSLTYMRVDLEISPAGLIDQRPCSECPSNAAKQAPLSNRGQHSQSIEPLAPTSAAVVQSPMSA
jgi:hypothetical protein